MFKRSIEEREIEKEKEKNRGDFTGFDEVDYVALEEDKYRVVRFLGNPIHQRQGDKYSPKVVHRSEIVDDKGKKMKVNWPSREENDGWILYKVMDKVLSYKWNKDLQKREYFYDEKHPEVFQRVLKNNGTHQYSQGWKPKHLVVANVIDRGMAEWHKEHKKTLILSRSANTSGDVTYYDFGIPESTYNMFFDSVVSYAGDWENYDVVIGRLKEDPWYVIYHGPDDRKKYDRLLPKIMGSVEFVDRPLTEEELAYERVDIDKITQITKYKKIKDRLGIFIQQVDSLFNTKFYDELLKLVATEEANSAKNKEVASDDDESSESPKASSNEAKSSAEVAPRRSEPKPTPTKVEVDYEALKAKGFKGIDYLTDDMKKLIIGIDANDQFIYDTDNCGTIYSCTDDECGYKSPFSFTHCPKCGVKF